MERHTKSLGWDDSVEFEPAEEGDAGGGRREARGTRVCPRDEEEEMGRFHAGYLLGLYHKRALMKDTVRYGCDGRYKRGRTWGHEAHLVGVDFLMALGMRGGDRGDPFQ